MQYQKPKGTRDISGLDLKRLEGVIAFAREYFGRSGYDEIRTPTFEAVELFSRSIGENTDIVEKEMFTFEHDKHRYALRPEGTASVLRAVIEGNLSLPQRFFYAGSMFRKERPQKGRYREFVQIGIELLGEASPYYDAEISFLASGFLRAIGLQNFRLEINSIGCRTCRAEFRERFSAYLKPRLGEVCEDCRRRFETNYLRVFDCKNPVCQAVYATAPVIVQHLCPDCAAHYDRFKVFLNGFGIEYQENPRLVRGLDYYTRTVIEFKAEGLGSQDTVLAGGRYDRLMAELGGQDAPCFGWAMGVERTLIALPENKPELPARRKIFIALIGETHLAELRALRSTLADQPLVIITGDPADPIKRQFKTANRYDVDFVLVYGEDEAKAGVYSLKDMRTGEQRQIPKQHLTEYLK